MPLYAIPPAPKVMVLTRDLSLSSGAVATTGVGFRPRGLVAMGGINGVANNVTNLGLFTGAGASGNVGLFSTNAATCTSANFFSFLDATGANNQVAGVTSFDTDGFTLTWTKTGSPTGTVTIYILCLP